MKLIFVPATGLALSRFVANIRDEDLAEVAYHCPGREPRSYLLEAAPQRHQALIACAPDGTPLCLFGCEPYDGCGVPWLLCTNAMRNHARPVLRACQSFVSAWLAQYRTLRNVTWAGNTMHHRLIESLGFAINPTVVPLNGGDFLYFEKTRV